MNEEAFLDDFSGISLEQLLTATDDIDILVSLWSKLFSAIL